MSYLKKTMHVEIDQKLMDELKDPTITHIKCDKCGKEEDKVFHTQLYGIDFRADLCEHCETCLTHVIKDARIQAIIDFLSKKKG